MINLLIRWALEKRLTVVVLSIVTMALGVFVTLRMPVDVFPDLTAPTVTVLVEGHSLSPQEMETQVTFPIESVMNGASGVRRVRSGTALGITVVWVEFEWGTEIQRARQTVAERLSTIAGAMPEGVEAPKLAPVSSVMGEILFVSLTSDRHGPLELRTTATTVLKRRLLSVPGVSQVTPIGGDTKQYQVLLAPDRMRAYGVTADEVIEALAGSNQNVAAGVLHMGAQEVLVEGIGRVVGIDDIAAVQVARREGVPVTVRDLGQVVIGPALKRGTAAASRRGPNWEAIIEPGVVLAVQKQPGANTLELTGRLDRTLDELQAVLPAGMHINRNLFRQASFIQNSVDNTVSALVEGALFVVLVVAAFLASTRASVITLLALPLSLLITVLALELMGANINTMTLGGMAIAIGALVDDAIIDVENVLRRLRENRKLPEGRRKAAVSVIYAASVEVRGSIVLATFIILLVFAPLFFLSGVEGRLLRPLGLAFTVSLAASLLTALTLTPALCSLLLPNSRIVTKGGEPPLVHWLQKLYARPLEWALNHPWIVGIPSAAMLAIATWSAATMGRGFLPEFNEGALVVEVASLPGTSIAQGDQLAQLVEREVMQEPEVVAIGRRTGRAEEDEHVQGVEASEMDMTLDMEAPVRLGKPRRTKDELLESLRERLARIPGIQASFGQPIGHRIDHMLSGTRASIAVKLFGPDLGQLRDLGAKIEEVMGTVPGVVDLSVERQALVPTVRIEFDRAAIARHGLHIEDVAHAVELATKGSVASEVLEGTNPVALVVRTSGAGELDPEYLPDVLVEAPEGQRIPLRALASVREDRTPNFISRENAQRKIVVMCNVAGRDLRGVVEEIRAGIESRVDLPSGYWVEYGGQFESAQATGELLGVLGILIVASIAFLLYFAFGSVRDAALILLNLPLALIGGVLGVYLTGGVLTVASIIGFITVFGVAARNGIMLVSHIRHLQRHEGVRDFREAVRRGALERLAPILMTALAAGLALIPLALRGDKPGSEILTPMAVVILWGLLSSTLLNMLLVPSLFLRFAIPAESGEENDMPMEVTGAEA
jgi:CzcA family heavy metal efflux pump